MGCGNSSAASTSGGVSSGKSAFIDKVLVTACEYQKYSDILRPAEASKEVTEEPSPDEEKRRNYGGVYVGLPVDMSTVATSQSKSTLKD